MDEIGVIENRASMGIYIGDTRIPTLGIISVTIGDGADATTTRYNSVGEDLGQGDHVGFTNAEVI